MSTTRLNWLICIAADARVSAVTCRAAAGLAALADDQNRVRSRMTMLSSACAITTRRIVDHLERLLELGYLRQQDISRQGRFSVTLVPQGDDAALASNKPFLSVAGDVVGVVVKSKTAVVAYVESDAEMLKLTIGHDCAVAIAAALAPDGADQGSSAN